jgi:hypothetical protein
MKVLLMLLLWELDFVQGNTKNLTGKLKTQVIGHGARTNNVNTLEGRQGFEIAQLIKTLTGCHAWFAVGYHYYFAVVISIDCALVAFDYKRFIK